MGATADVTPQDTAGSAEDAHVLTPAESRLRSLCLETIQAIDPLMLHLDEVIERIASIADEDRQGNIAAPLVDDTDREVLVDNVAKLGSHARSVIDGLTSILGRALVRGMLEEE